MLRFDSSALDPKPPSYPENGELIQDDDWYLCVDAEARWKDDEIFLPGDVAWKSGRLCGKGNPLQENEPTGGWKMLGAESGKSVILPTSVEQHFWGHYGANKDGKPHPYTPDEYRYAAKKGSAPPADDAAPQNGAYYGVSWFFRSIYIPKSIAGRSCYKSRTGSKRVYIPMRGPL